jgi:Rrf2 family protein
MRVSALEEYGLRCLVTLAREGLEGQLSIAEIAEREGLSFPYASKLLAILRKEGLVTAERGRGGGFSIARSPEEINLYQVITALGGPIIDPDHCAKYSGQKDECVHLDQCSVHQILGGLAGYIQEFLTRATLADLLTSRVGLPFRVVDGQVVLDNRSLDADFESEDTIEIKAEKTQD